MTLCITSLAIMGFKKFQLGLEAALQVPPYATENATAPLAG